MIRNLCVAPARSPRVVTCASCLLRLTDGTHQRVVTRTSATLSEDTTSKAVEHVQTSETRLTEYGAVVNSYIPISSRQLFMRLSKDSSLSSVASSRRFDQFSLLLDSSIDRKIRNTQSTLKHNYEYINPDQDTVISSSHDWSENEFWVLKKLDSMLLNANFTELPREIVEKYLNNYKSSEGVLVHVNSSKYDVLRFWALGEYVDSPSSLPALQRMKLKMNSLMNRKQQVVSTKHHKRVVVACRRKGDKQLTLKCFKDVPVGALEQLVPGAHVKMKNMDQIMIYSLGGVAFLSGLTKLVTWLSKTEVNWVLIVGGFSGLFGAQLWSRYNYRKLRYLRQLNDMLYYKNVANNRGLITLVMDRAQDELFKESLLVYTLVASNSAIDGFSPDDINRAVEAWTSKTLASEVQFDSIEAITTLNDLGLIVPGKHGLIKVLNVEDAFTKLSSQDSSYKDIEDSDL